MDRIAKLFRISGAALLLALLVAACDSVEERVENHYERGRQLVADGEPQKAKLEFRNALKLDGDFAPAHFAMGQIHEADGELEQAFTRFRRTVELQPQHLEGRLRNARYFIMAGELERARENWDVARTLDPEGLGVFTIGAALEIESGNWDVANDLLQRAKALDPEDVSLAIAEATLLERTGRMTEALEIVDGALVSNDENMLVHLTRLRLLSGLDLQDLIGDQLARLIAFDRDAERFREMRFDWAIRNDNADAAIEEMRVLVASRPEEEGLAVRLVRLVQVARGDQAARDELARLVAESETPERYRLISVQFEMDLGNRSGAIKVLEEMIARGGDSANRARMALASIRTAEGDRETALALSREVLTTDRNNVDALAILAAHQVRQNDLETAVETIRQGLNEEPDDLRLLALAARAQERLGNINLANDRLARALRVAEYAPSYVKAYVAFLNRIERTAAAETVLNEAVRRNPQDLELLELLGFIRVELTDFDGAELIARRLANANPDTANQLMARVLLEQEKFDEGVSLLSQLPSDDVRRTAAVAKVVQAYVDSGDLGAAFGFLRQRLEENPNDTQALGLTGNMLLAQGAYEEAEQYYRRVLELDPDNGGAYSALMRLFSGQGRFDDAEQALLEGYAIAPENLIIRTRLAQLREAQGRIDEAIELYRAVHAAAPDSIIVANNLASLLADHHYEDPAAVDLAYQLAGRLRDSSRPHYLDTFAWTRYLKGEHEEARAAIDQVLGALPNNPWVRYHAGMIYAALGETARATAELQLALDLADAAFTPRAKAEARLRELEAG